MRHVLDSSCCDLCCHGTSCVMHYVTAVPLGIIVVENNADLEQVREQINKIHLPVSDDSFVRE